MRQVPTIKLPICPSPTWVKQNRWSLIFSLFRQQSPSAILAGFTLYMYVGDMTIWILKAIRYWRWLIDQIKYFCLGCCLCHQETKLKFIQCDLRKQLKKKKQFMIISKFCMQLWTMTLIYNLLLQNHIYRAVSKLNDRTKQKKPAPTSNHD